MIGDSFLPLGRAARRIVAAGLVITVTLPAFAQDNQGSPPPPADQAAPPADAPTAPAEAAPAPAPEATATVPVKPLSAEQAPPPPAAKEATQLESIEVTGSRLKRTDYESAQPVVSISREDIERTGQTDITEILRRLSVAGNSSSTPQFARGYISYGETNLDLRSLGATHTLLLVNGHRWINGLSSTSTSVSDFNTIPTTIIDRIEILKDGASAIYGSDAIGGVVNIITRKDYEGIGVSYQMGAFDKYWDGINRQASVSWGKTTPSSSFFLNLGYTDQDRAPNESRPLTATPNAGVGRQSAVTTRGTVILYESNGNSLSNYYGCPTLISVDPAQTQQVPIRNTTGFGPNQVGTGLTQCTLQRSFPDTGGATLADWHQGARTDPGVDPRDVANRFGEGSLTEPSQRSSLFTQYTQTLSENLNFSLEALYNVRKSTSVGARGYLGGGDRELVHSKSVVAYIPSTNPGNPFGQDIGLDSSCTGLPGGQDDPSCTHLGAGAGLWAMRVGGDRDNSISHDAVNSARIGAGLKGDFDFIGMPASWDGGYIFSNSKLNDTFVNARYDLEAQALGNGPTPCTSPCVPLDVLHGAAALDPGAVNYVIYGAYQRNSSRRDIVYADASGGIPIGWLPSPLAIAAGFEMRRDRYASDVDPVIQQGLTFYNKLANTSGTTFAREAYVELGQTLVQDVPFVRVLDLDLAGRYSRYPGFGSVTTYKAGSRWKPIDDLLVRGTYSTGFRAPNVGELYISPSQSFDGVPDPCVVASGTTDTTTQQNCVADGGNSGGAGQNPLFSSYDQWQGNPNLKPERSTNLTYGIVYSPHWVPDLNLSLDFYKIEIKDYIVVGGLVGTYFANSCESTPRPAGSGPNSGPFCNYVHRDASGTLQYIDTPYFNLAAVRTQGIDGNIDYILPLPDGVGRFKIALEGSYLTQYDYELPSVIFGQTVFGGVGTQGSLGTGTPRWKANAVLSWKREQWNAAWSTRMAYHMNQVCLDPFVPTLDSLGLCNNVTVIPADPADPTSSETRIAENMLRTVFYHNLQVGRELPSLNSEVSLGVQNVFAHDPPIDRGIASIQWYNYDPSQYEPPGRTVYMRAELKF